MKELFIDKYIEIDAPVENVWKILIEKEYTKEWIDEFDPSLTTLESEWELGSPVHWYDKDENMLVRGNVTEIEKYKLLRYTTIDMNQEETPDEEDGITFELLKTDGKTRLHVLHGDFSKIKDGEKYYGVSSEAWDRIILKVKDLAEKMRAKEVVITYVFDIPIKKVWEHWTEEEKIKEWWGPNFFTSPFCIVDFREGGRYHFCMQDSDGIDFWNTGTYKKIIPFEEVVVSDSFSDEFGNIVPASSYGLSEKWPLEIETRFHFEDLGGRTKLTIIYPDTDGIEDIDIKNMEEGWKQSLQKLDQILLKENLIKPKS